MSRNLIESGVWQTGELLKLVGLVPSGLPWREVNILSKCQVPSSYGLGVKVFLKMIEVF